MTDEGTRSIQADDFRARAEQAARASATEIPEYLQALSPEVARQALHELQVHQIELEMQNEELRRAQEELEVAGIRYFELYDLAPVGYVTLSEDGLVLEANLTAAIMLGMARSALVKRPLSRFILPEDQDMYYQHRKQLIETGKPQACELRMLGAGGSPFWAHLAETSGLDAGGAPECRVIMSDLTERKKMDEALRESEGKYRAIVDSTSDYIMRYDRSGRHLYGNPAALKATGVTLEEYVGKTHRDLGFPEPLCRLWEANLEAVFRTGEPVTIEFEVELAEGRQFLELKLCPESVSEGKVNGVVGISRDITERKRAEAERAEIEAQRQQFQKSESLGRMAGAIAHQGELD